MLFQFKYIKGKYFTAILALVAIVLCSVVSPLTFSSVILAQEEVVKEENVIPLVGAEETLEYLKKIDTNRGRADFADFLEKKQEEKERLSYVRDNISHQITAEHQFQSFLPSIIAPDFLTIEHEDAAVHETEDTISDLIEVIESEIEVQRMVFREIDAIRQLASLLKADEVCQKVDKLQQKSELEKVLIDRLQEGGDLDSNPLLGELILEKNLTELWSLYAISCKDVFVQLEAYMDQSILFLSDKISKEELILSYIKKLYPDEDKNSVLDETAYELIELYRHEEADKLISKFETTLIHADVILSVFILGERMNISPDLPVQMQFLSNLTGESDVRADIKEDLFTRNSENLYNFLVQKNQIDLSSSVAFDNQYKILRSLNVLMTFADPLTYSKNLDYFRNTYIYVQNFEVLLGRAVTRLELVPAEEVTIEVEEEPSCIGAVPPTENRFIEHLDRGVK